MLTTYEKVDKLEYIKTKSCLLKYTLKFKKFQFVEDICKKVLKLRTSKEFLQINKDKKE